GQARFLEVLRDARFLAEERFFDPLFFGTLPPARRASDKPIAMACLRLVTFFPDFSLRRFPSLRSFLALWTFFSAFAPYLAIRRLLLIVIRCAARRVVGAPQQLLFPAVCKWFSRY